MSPDGSAGSQPFTDFLRKSWRGEERLVRTFWWGSLLTLFVAIVSLFAALLGGAILLGPIAIVFSVPPGPVYEAVAAAIFFGGFGPSAVWWLVSVWRCAPNSGRRLWFFVARAVVLGNAATVGLTLLV